MPHSVWNLGSLAASARLQPRQFIAGIEPARSVFIGRAREPKNMIVLLDAWIEFVTGIGAGAGPGESGKYSLALGRDPLNTALLLPVGIVRYTGDATNNTSWEIDQLFKAHGKMWAAQYIAVDFQEFGSVTVDADLHLDWGVATVDWWTWFYSWNNMEVSPDGGLVDGEQEYA